MKKNGLLYRSLTEKSIPGFTPPGSPE